MHENGFFNRILTKMKAHQTLPETYDCAGKLDLSKGLPLVVMNVVAVILFVIFGWAFIQLTRILRPEGQLLGDAATTFQGLSWPLLLVLLVVATLVLHELIHGAFFMLFTGKSPKFGFKLSFAYAAAPDWYLPRNQHILVGLAPLAMMTIFGSGLIPLIPTDLLPYWLVCLSFNAAGAIGDIITVAWEFTKSSQAYIRDTGDTFYAYEPAVRLQSKP